MKREQWVRKIIKGSLLKWYSRSGKLLLESEIESKVNEEIFTIKDTLYVTLAEFGSTAHRVNAWTSGLWKSNQIAHLLAGTPVIDSRKATIKGKSILINCNKLADYERQRETLEENGVKFFNFAKMEQFKQEAMI